MFALAIKSSRATLSLLRFNSRPRLGNDSFCHPPLLCFTHLLTRQDHSQVIGHMSSRTDPADVRSWTLQVPQVSNTEGNWDLWSSPLAYFIVGGACRACNLLPLHALCWVSEANFRGKFQRQNCAIGACFVMTLDDLGRNVLCCDHECNSAEQRAG